MSTNFAATSLDRRWRSSVRVKSVMNSDSAVELLMGTYVSESTVRGDTYLRQIPNGPAESVFQIEPATHRAHRRWLQRPKNRTLLEVVDSLLAPGVPITHQMTWNLMYACAIARVHYWRRPGALPSADDVVGMANYWKRHYNTFLGKGNPKVWARNYRRYCLPSVARRPSAGP